MALSLLRCTASWLLFLQRRESGTGILGRKHRLLSRRTTSWQASWYWMSVGSGSEWSKKGGMYVCSVKIGGLSDANFNGQSVGDVACRHCCWPLT